VKLSTKALAWTAAVLWGATVFVVGILNLIWPSYAAAFLDMVKSIYPGYGAMSGFLAVIVGTLYALVDGAICGALFGWLYNMFAQPSSAPAA
jgi:hypothetical protein